MFDKSSTSQPRSIEGIEGLNRKPKMSRRIDRVVTAENLVALFISGRITGEHVDILRGVLEQESGGFAIDLKNVLLVDREAVNSSFSARPTERNSGIVRLMSVNGSRERGRRRTGAHRSKG